MNYLVRLMHHEDINEVTEIDRQAFPSTWPPPRYEREMENKVSHHIVVARDTPECRDKTVIEKEPSLTSRVRRFFSATRASNDSDRICIVGFAGCWMMAGEAHVTSIAVREAYRGQGIGELLMISLVELARDLEADMLTLEARVSNTVAQNLYRKFGFTEVGMRPRYYIDNGEDAIIMSVEDFKLPSFEEHFQQIKGEFSRQHGMSISKVNR
jgi:ribosomal-protein-alanine N-acetyltransferase